MLGSVLLAPFIALLVIILSLASLGRSFGIRKAYVDLLLRLFEVSDWHRAQLMQGSVREGRKSVCWRDQLRHIKYLKIDENASSLKFQDHNKLMCKAAVGTIHVHAKRLDSSLLESRLSCNRERLCRHNKKIILRLFRRADGGSEVDFSDKSI